MLIKGKRWSAREVNGEVIVEEKENNMFSKIKEKAIEIKEDADSFVKACKLGNEMRKVIKRIKFMMAESKNIDFDLAYAIATIRLDQEIYGDEFVKQRIGSIVKGEL